MSTTNREKFERWAAGENLPLEKHRTGHYDSDATENAWDAWKACIAAREADAVPVVFVSPEALRNVAEGKIGREWLWPKPNDGDIALYAAPVAKEAAAPAEQYYDTAHELFAVSQLAPGEGIEDAVGRISALLADQTRSEQVVGGGVPEPQFVAEAKSSPEHQTDMLLCRAVLNHAVIDTPPPAAATHGVSDRYRAVMEAQEGVRDERPIMPYNGTEAASMMRTVIDDILSQAKGTHETAHDFVAWHLPRIRSLLQWIDAALAAHPHTGHSAVPEGDKS